ncbi:carbohydrate ABC transporter permease [Paenibacillus sp. GCM10023248]|uniref:carbohydrate ABC transporter permease n=1 Tax=Bacillales TaxID=1385 RepID=UPI0023788766|nr:MULTISPECIES: carbohydrate ABC transporter permease [Bacillales]MDD9265610.1 carbohydrate ABC transporter permease [Paenibacillus sp. MAHUQ-63]MDR6878849.1 multiple sugar transport system permease protein [Bacillus sp. 3255]
MKDDRLLTHLGLLAGALLMVLPFLWMALTSVKTFAESMHAPPTLFPAVWQFANYIKVFQTTDLLRYLGNTVLVTVVKTAGQLLFCSMAAFAFATLRFPWKNTLFLLMLSVMMLPHQLTLVPTFLLIKQLGWLNTYQALIVPGLASAFGIFLLRQFFLSLPAEIGEAAKVDGFSYPRIYWSIYMALSRPGLVSLAIFVIIASWNDFLNPLVLTSSDQMRLLSLGVASFVGEFATDYPLMMAAACIAVLPLIVIFMVLQRYFIQGIALTGVKS